MLPFFPTPYHDELLYSVFARYHLRSANVSFRATLNDLFGSPNACAVVTLPVRLAALEERLPSRTALPIMQLIRDHTGFPFYRPFLARKRAEKVVMQMSDPKSGSGVCNTIGQMASRVPEVSALRFCSKCIEEDEKEFGEPYWHRSHQVFGVRLCHRHGQWLIESPVKTGSLGTKHAFIALEPIEPESDLREADKSLQGHDKWLAAEVHWLLNKSHDLPALELESLRLRYRYYLSQMGLTSFHGNVACRELMARFTEFYTEEFLEDLHCPLTACSSDNWLLDLIRKTRCVSHPLHHLLLSRFLGLTVQKFLSEEVPQPQPFGRCPWPCLNRAAAHFRKAVIWHCPITRNTETGAPVGTFSCSCGFSYSRTGPDKVHEDRFHFSRIVAFGHVWEERLLHLATAGKSLREIARQLEVDPKTVRMHLSLLRENISRISIPSDISAERDVQRTKWLELCSSQPDVGAKRLRKQAPASYSWLYRHDWEWLMEHSPRQHRKRLVSSGVDWVRRDAELSERIDDAVKAIMQKTYPAMRVTISSIGKELGALSLVQRHLDKLPLARIKIERVLESREDFAVRRLKAAAERFHQLGETPQRWELLRTAGIRKEVADKIEGEIAAVSRT
ncbi:MAG: TnsD family transposase [Geobacteraceae bacterium]|nr:TnsD family transposase [Geobacteraceae bacterium]